MLRLLELLNVEAFKDVKVLINVTVRTNCIFRKSAAIKDSVTNAEIKMISMNHSDIFLLRQYKLKRLSRVFSRRRFVRIVINYTLITDSDCFAD